MGVVPRAIAVEFFPLHQVALAAVCLDQPVNVVHASATALGALNTEHAELAFNVAKERDRPSSCSFAVAQGVVQPQLLSTSLHQSRGISSGGRSGSEQPISVSAINGNNILMPQVTGFGAGLREPEEMCAG
jgi:hypothetical protein